MASALRAGAKAYGFTLVIWTTGALAISEQGVPRASEALAYLGGALLGMALIVAASFGGLRSTSGDVGLVRRAYGAIHVLSVVAGVLTGWLLAAVLDGVLSFLAASFAAVVIYNLLALEVAFSIVDALGIGDGARRPARGERDGRSWRAPLCSADAARPLIPTGPPGGRDSPPGRRR